ncbi:MAG: RlmE family RNA methyltransferase [Deltaproteobacteria bacterium]|nr:RlmE family RNA methyltransferase [Candidatus Anaeroferrophillus wilburensis]MBN2888088.1 RlmE family RNA methyltransferase [Deltaproteobacteria bacterium]
MAFERKDGFYRKAKREGLRSRAAFKIEQLHQRYQLFKKSDSILELGAAPGGWMQIIARLVGAKGLVLGIDLLPIAGLPSPPCQTIQEDIFTDTVGKQIQTFTNQLFDGVISDIAPNLSGIKAADQLRAHELNRRAMELACTFLKPGGFFLCKVFQHEGLHELRLEAGQYFEKVTVTKPEASRKSSAELYLVALKYRGQKAKGPDTPGL